MGLRRLGAAPGAHTETQGVPRAGWGPTLPAGGVVSTRQGFSLPARVCGLAVFVRPLRSWRCRGPGISYGLGGHCWTLCMRRTAGDKQDRRSLLTGEEAGRHLRPLLIPEAAANCCSKCVHREKHERNDLERGRHRSGDSNAVFVACMAEEKEGLEQKESSPERQGARQGDRGPNQTRAGRAPSSWSPDGLASLPGAAPAQMQPRPHLSETSSVSAHLAMVEGDMIEARRSCPRSGNSLLCPLRI